MNSPAGVDADPRLLVLGDSLTFHGPDQAHPPSDPRLWPNVAAGRGEVDVAAGVGWTARDAWWALTRDPRIWGEFLPRADALVIAVGGMDALPAAIPTYLRQGIAYIRPGWVRRRVRGFYLTASPHVVRVLAGPLRQLPQAATDHYLTRIVQAVRTWYPDLPILALTPPPHRAGLYPTQRFFADSVAAAHAWGRREEVMIVDVTELVQQGLDAGTHSPDGMHFGWPTHQMLGQMVAEAVAAASVP